MELTLTSKNFDKTIASDKPVLVDFWASWCGPCRMIAPTVAAVAEERQDIIVGKVNVDDEPYIANQYRVNVIPTLIVFKNGEIAARAEGLRSKSDLLRMIDGN